MTIFFPDVSHYQSGLIIQPGTVAVIAKATEGTTYYDSSYLNFKGQAASVGAVFAGYHYLHAGYTLAQAQFCKSKVGDTPIMLDVEAGSGGVGDIVGFVDSFRSLGGKCNLVYLPRWYWNNIGSPSLAPLTSRGLKLVSSHYTTYSDSGPGWVDYGGADVAQWQYSDNQPYGGFHVDFNAYKGTPTEYAALLGYPQPDPPPTPDPPEDSDMSFSDSEMLPVGFAAVDSVLFNKSWAPGVLYLSTEYGVAKVRVAIHTANVGYTSAVIYTLSNSDLNHVDVQLPQNTDRVTVSRMQIDSNDTGTVPVKATLYQPVF